MECGKTVFVFLVDVRALFEKTLQRGQSPRDPPAYRNTPSHGLHLPTLLPHGAASLHGLWTPCSDHYARAATTFSASVGDLNLGLRDFTCSFLPFVLKAETLKGLSPKPASADDWVPLRNNKLGREVGRLNRRRHGYRMSHGGEEGSRATCTERRASCFRKLGRRKDTVAKKVRLLAETRG